MRLKIPVLFCMVCLLCAACSSRYYMRRGNLIYDTGRFHKASSKYEKAFDKTKNPEMQAKVAMRTGEAYEQVNNLRDADSWYRKAVRADKMLPEAYLKLAAVNMQNGEFEKSEAYYRKYEELFGDSRGENGIHTMEQIRKGLGMEGRYAVVLKKEFNSRYTDFAPVYYPGDTCLVYFASTRDPKKKNRFKADPVTGERFSHIFITEYTQEIKTKDKRGNIAVKRFKVPKWLEPALIRDSLLSPKHEGAMCFDENGGTLYFTSSRVVKGSNVGTRIYKVTKGAIGKKDEGDENTRQGWVGLSQSGICGDTVSVGHPALTPDGSRIYFVTDQLPGGLGGKDIWFVEKAGEKWGEPQNAGDVINTEGNELFPYVRDNGELYFASDGHDGFGGLDIYKVKEEDGQQTLEHLPAPLNSFSDDFGITFKPGQDEGLLTSSRSNRSDNIYSFNFIPQQLQVRLLVRNNITELPVVKAGVTVTCDDGTTTFLETDSLGLAGMGIQPQREYAFVVEHPRYLKGKGIVSTYREKGDRFYELTVEMQPIEIPIVIPNIYFDIAKWELRKDAIANLKELLFILKDNPNITIELSAHTDMIGNDQANMLLSENRAKSVVEYLISQGIYWDRLQAKGYGETMPRRIDEKLAQAYPFLQAGEVLNEKRINRLKETDKEDAMQLNRRIEFRVLRTDYKPGPYSLHNPNKAALAAGGEIQTVGKTQLRDLKSVEGKFFTLQLGVFKNIPTLLDQFKIVFTEKVKDKGIRYCTGVYDTRKEAVEAAAVLKKKGIDSIVIAR